jgi:hypothetical protein
MDTVEEVINFYITTSAMARQGQVENAAPELSDIFIDSRDLAPLGAFLRALNEDYSFNEAQPQTDEL